MANNTFQLYQQDNSINLSLRGLNIYSLFNHSLSFLFIVIHFNLSSSHHNHSSEIFRGLKKMHEMPLINTKRITDMYIKSLGEFEGV